MGKRKAIKKLLKPTAPTPVYEYEDVAIEDLVVLSDDESSAPVQPTAPAASSSAPPPVASTGSATAGNGIATPSASESDADGLRDTIREKLGGKKSSKQRFAERQARKQQALLDSAPPQDPAWNAQLEKERQEEITVISDACGVLGREIHEIQPDGHCMYSAVADQLGLLGILAPQEADNPYTTRHAAAKYMREHKDDFLPFLPSVDGEDMPGATDDGIMNDAQFEEYCHRVEETGEWGGEPEIQALSRAFNVPIHVIQRGPPTVVSHGGSEDAFGGAMDAKASAAAGERIVRITYHRRMYGLGEHYNSLRPAKAT
ncbi:cysteine proteinase [Cutaneotrichosporon oleaginosum]|uniref:Cysteine proteinase n=1 Tax=Cutaneotrichosporon oleaginosum TaxID=879819 RepID=A0A0J0XM46_9TREE|nr:cysteine proteinase [Cutaneotrichosporon oleaginosum]KLT42185.1 cysteine proteinase [Cutaneotrichosporon oleaginosum]TXT11694.1 hypothetical protein COLE_02104 [Cutaneotrichosporon oleaginosum]